MSTTAPATAFHGEVVFAKSDNHIDTLRVLELGIGREASIHLPAGEVTHDTFSLVAKKLANAEAAQAWIEGPLPLVAGGRQATQRHPLNWLNLCERKTSDEARQCHDIYLAHEDNCLRLTFNHGKFGYRNERHTKWSSAFARLAQLLAGECSWHQFGDPESQLTMLGKGQFYWQDTRSLTLVPVDNFVFRIADELDIRLAGVGHQCALSVDRADGESGNEWYADYSEGLLRMADIFAGMVDLAMFGVESSPEQHSCTKSDSVPKDGGTALSARGRFFVETIYDSGDVWEAPVLVYQTEEGKKAALHVTDAAWSVRLCEEEGRWKERSFPAATAPSALRTLARALNGTLLWSDF